MPSFQHLASPCRLASLPNDKPSSPAHLPCVLKEDKKRFMRADGKAMLLEAVPAETTPGPADVSADATPEPTVGATAEGTPEGSPEASLGPTADENAEEMRNLAECELTPCAITAVGSVSMSGTVGWRYTLPNEISFTSAEFEDHDLCLLIHVPRPRNTHAPLKSYFFCERKQR